jgi:hypothetical protein
MREYRLQIPSGLAGYTCESGIVQKRHLQGKGERALYEYGVLCMLSGAYPHFLGFSTFVWN